MMDTLILYLQYPFVQYALIVGVLIALCSSLFGVSLVLKRFSFIGDGLSHVAFGSMAIAGILHFSNEMLISLPITVMCAILLLKNGQRSRINGDAVVAMLSVGSLAVGYLLLNLFSTSSNLSGDVCSTLFGSTSILTLGVYEVWVSVIVSIAVLFLFIMLYRKLFAITFDESFSKAIGINTEGYNLLIAIIMAVIIVLSMNLVGSLLISALIVFPAMAAMQVCQSFKGVTVFSAVFSVLCALLGILSSILAGTPVGSSIVATDIIGFLLFMMIRKIRVRFA